MLCGSGPIWGAGKSTAAKDEYGDASARARGVAVSILIKIVHVCNGKWWLAPSSSRGGMETGGELTCSRRAGRRCAPRSSLMRLCQHTQAQLRHTSPVTRYSRAHDAAPLAQTRGLVRHARAGVPWHLGRPMRCDPAALGAGGGRRLADWWRGPTLRARSLARRKASTASDLVQHSSGVASGCSARPGVGRGQRGAGALGSPGCPALPGTYRAQTLAPAPRPSHPAPAPPPQHPTPASGTRMPAPGIAPTRRRHPTPVVRRLPVVRRRASGAQRHEGPLLGAGLPPSPPAAASLGRAGDA